MSEVHLIATDTGKYISLSDVESISLNWRFTEIQNFGTVGSFTKQFKIPFDDVNQSIFGPLFDVNFTPDTNYFHVKLPAELRVDTLPISVGHIQVLRVTKQLDVISSLEIVFYAETPNLVKALGTKKLADIAQLATLDHTMTYENVIQGTYDYRYCLADRGFKFSELGESGTARVLDLNNPLYPGVFTPLVRWEFLFEWIIKEAGFTYDADILIPILRGYWMPWVNTKWIQYENPPEQYFFSAGYTTDQTSFAGGQLTGLSEQFDNNGNFSSSVYTAPFAGMYTFRVYITIQAVTGQNWNPSLRFVDNATGDVLAIALFMTPTDTEYTNYANTVNVLLEAGQSVKLSLSNALGTYNLQGSATYDEQFGTGWRMIGFEGALYGQEVIMSKNAPDMTQVDFIKDVISMHNLAVIPDRNIPGKLQFIPMNDYIGSGEERDWTSKLDISKDIVIEPTTDLQNRKLTWTYKEGGDVWNKLFQEAGRVYGNYEVTGYTVNPNETASDFAQGEFTVKLATQPTPCNAINGTSIVIPKFMNDAGNFVVPGPRCVYLAGSAEVAMWDDVNETAQFEGIYLVNHYSVINAEVDDYDLNFAPDTQPHSIVGQPYNNLFNLYWRRYINEIYSPEARLMTAYFNLNITDVLQFSFADRIFIKNAWWRILEINGYKVGDSESTQIKLLKLLDTTPDCTLTPSTITTGGIVNFVDANGDPADATEACCTRYGYEWGGLNCFAFGGGRDDRPGAIGTQGVGYSIGQVTGSDYTVSLATRLRTDPSNIFSINAGNNIYLDADNESTLAMGDTIRLEGSQRNGTALIGKNIRTNMPGIHLGGGWFNDAHDGEQGEVQSGTVMFSLKGGFSNSSTELELLIEGISGKRINLPAKVGVACVLTVNLQQIASGVIVNDAIVQFGFVLRKEIVMGVPTATAGTVHEIFKETTFVTPNLIIDTTTNVAEHRLKISTTGSGHPHNDCYIVAKLDYNQFRHA